MNCRDSHMLSKCSTAEPHLGPALNLVCVCPSASVPLSFLSITVRTRCLRYHVKRVLQGSCALVSISARSWLVECRDVGFRSCKTEGLHGLPRGELGRPCLLEEEDVSLQRHRPVHGDRGYMWGGPECRDGKIPILQAERGCNPSPLCLARPQSPGLKLPMRILRQASWGASVSTFVGYPLSGRTCECRPKRLQPLNEYAHW